jgi:hypothetical protein
LEYDPDASQLDTTFWAIGWNPLSDIIVLFASALFTALNAATDDVAARLRTGVQEAIDDGNQLRFPDAFTVGPATERDAASEIVGDPRQVEALMEPNQSVFYRGIYGFTSATDPPPLDRNLSRDGTYFFHRRVLEEMIRARLGVDGRALGVAWPKTDASAADLISAEIRDAVEFGPDLLAQMVDLGMMTAELRQSWLAYLEARRGWLSFEGMSEGRILLQAQAGAKLVNRLEGRAGIQWSDISLPIFADAAVASVVVELTGRNTVETRFRTDRGDGLLSWLKFMEEEVWDQVPLPSGVFLPKSSGAIDLFTTSIYSSGLLHVGLWKQRLEVTPGFPASFDFAVRRFDVTSDGDTKFLVDSEEFATDARAQLVRDALRVFFPGPLAELDRPLVDVGRYASFEGAEVGLHWRVVDAAGTNRFVRIKGDRLYLDFEVDPLIIQSLG